MDIHPLITGYSGMLERVRDGAQAKSKTCGRRVDGRISLEMGLSTYEQI